MVRRAGEGFGAVASSAALQCLDGSRRQGDPVAAAGGLRFIENQAVVVDGNEGVADEQQMGVKADVASVQAECFAFAHAGIDE